MTAQMTKPLRTFLAQASAFFTMVCMVAMVMSGYASANSSVQILEHKLAGDRQLSDGGWIAHCVDRDGNCTGHVTDDQAPSFDPIALHHHHHSSGEVSPGIMPFASTGLNDRRSVEAILRPDTASPLANRSLSMPLQPPRA